MFNFEKSDENLFVLSQDDVGLTYITMKGINQLINASLQVFYDEAVKATSGMTKNEHKES
jgi:hypothetical protein